MAKVCVLLSGSGVYDGAELHEAVLTLLALHEAGAEVLMAAPSGPQFHVINHLTGAVAEGETRDILVESARVARGEITALDQVSIDELDAVVLPGGFGVAKNLCSFAFDGPECSVHEGVARFLREARARSLPLGFACISPALAAAVFREGTLTVGRDDDGASEGLRALGATAVACEASGVIVDEERRTVSTPAYMTGTSLVELRAGLKGMVDQVLEWALDDAQRDALGTLEGWSLDGRSICRAWRFEDDKASIDWVNRVWSLAQAQGHHPDIELSYATVTIRLTTHDEGGLSEADFALARQIDAL